MTSKTITIDCPPTPEGMALIEQALAEAAPRGGLDLTPSPETPTPADMQPCEECGTMGVVFVGPDQSREGTCTACGGGGYIETPTPADMPSSTPTHPLYLPSSEPPCGLFQCGPFWLDIRRDLPEWRFVVRDRNNRWIAEVNRGLVEDREEWGNAFVSLANNVSTVSPPAQVEVPIATGKRKLLPTVEKPAPVVTVTDVDTFRGVGASFARIRWQLAGSEAEHMTEQRLDGQTAMSGRRSDIADALDIDIVTLRERLEAAQRRLSVLQSAVAWLRR